MSCRMCRVVRDREIEQPPCCLPPGHASEPMRCKTLTGTHARVRVVGRGGKPPRAAGTLAITSVFHHLFLFLFFLFAAPTLLFKSFCILSI